MGKHPDKNHMKTPVVGVVPVGTKHMNTTVKRPSTFLSQNSFPVKCVSTTVPAVVTTDNPNGRKAEDRDGRPSS